MKMRQELFTHHYTQCRTDISVTGDVVGELVRHNDGGWNSAVFDICVDGNRLILPVYKEWAVYYYQIKHRP